MEPWKDKRVIGNATLYLGDALEVLPTLGPVDTTITDPPYGVMLGEVSTGASREKGQQKYESFSDTPDYIKTVCVPIMTAAIAQSKRTVFTPGNRNCFLYPPPDDFGVWYNPAGTGRGRWGFILAQPIFYYGKDPRLGVNQSAASTWGHNDKVGDIKNVSHPCPKPYGFVKWMVAKASLDNETILDPFMGSGTTGAVCAQNNRNFIGIEIESKYYEIACERIENAQRQQRMFA